MDFEVNSAKGGVSILHKFQHGKHHYEVDRMVNYKSGHVTGPFVRKGDTLLKINGQDLENLTPETFAELLTKGSPVLTVHHSSRDTAQEKCEHPQGMHAFSKEKITMRLSLEMRQEEELEGESEENGGERDRGHPNGQREHSTGDSSSSLSELDNLLLVSMTKTSISIIAGRGCDSENPCHDCGGTNCNFNDVVVVAKSITLTMIPKDVANNNFFIHSLLHDMYICNRGRTVSMSSPPVSDAEISIYYYKSDSVDEDYPGLPVVLNFSRTENFLKCDRQDGKALLSVESCEKRKLKHIISKDKETWPFVFYMKGKDRGRRFESANCRGWFINSKNESIAAKRLETEDETFLFIIKKQSRL